MIRVWYAAAGLHYVAYRTGVIPYGSDMLANFYGGVCAWVVCFVVTSVASLRTRRRNPAELAGLVYSRTLPGIPRSAWVLSGAILVLLVALNWIFY